MTKRFYITTPIYYVNAEPHIGHAYTTIVADVLNRFHRLLGFETYFLTGTDEHGDKVAEAARKAGMAPKDYVDKISQMFRTAWPKLNITNDDFIRTTEPRHIRVVRYILQKVYDQGDIYFGRYKGLYCVGCERFYTQRELVDGKCPDHGVEPVEREEDNYFFRMSKYQDWLIDHIEKNPDFIRPKRYRNEVLAFLREPLEDLCISRPKERLSWGIPLPFDNNYVTYVWFDALINYISALDYPEGHLYKAFWPVSQHLIAKDILKPHAIYWPIMLRAAGIEPYRHLNVHGYWKIEEGKMSKSRGTVVRPLDLVPVYGVDAFRYFLLREMVFGLDSNFSEEALVGRLNADLANDLGNLFSRTLAMVGKFLGGRVPEFGTDPESIDHELINHVEATMESYVRDIPQLAFHRALIGIWECIGKANKYIDVVQPWELAKDSSQRERLQTVMRILLELNKTVGVLISPFMPSTAEEILNRLGIEKKATELRLESDGRWGNLSPGLPVRKGKALFPRVAVKRSLGESRDKDQHAVSDESKSTEQLISMEELNKIRLCCGVVKEAERIPRSNKLLCLKVDIGDERQIVAGIAQDYRPEELVGKQVVVVANIKPVKLMGVESQGMILAVQDGERLSLITPDQPVTPGSPIS